MTEHHEIIESRTSKIWIDDIGIVRILKKQVNDESIEDASENLMIIKKLTKGNPHVDLVDLSLLKNQHTSIVNHYVEQSENINCKAVAFLTSDLHNTYLGINNLILSEQKFPSKVFSSEEFAIEWLLSFK